jgi:hypothetical protein
MNPSEPGPVKSSAFVPLLLVTLAFITVETGTIMRERSQMRALKVQIEQIESASRASQDTDAKLQSLLSSLLHLAEADSDAKAIVTRYRLSFSPPSPSPDASR